MGYLGTLLKKRFNFHSKMNSCRGNDYTQDKAGNHFCSVTAIFSNTYVVKKSRLNIISAPNRSTKKFALAGAILG